ncbi:sugar ABC transporter permease [Acholeplasma hippikon]|uniref:Maltose transport system permease protein malG n=1 Tax=Acholeplasma hippikon TaxID=264636 RepID=A0A449BIR3_9MOLU|nr:sugar ABC transporter permease [Acholeplasma hippikon]VEU82349.1 Maltose transport system permease protein malG [Acholeplasma hippikon]
MSEAKVKKTLGVKAKRRITKVFLYITLVVLSIIWLYPVLWMVLTAFREEYNDLGNLIGIVSGKYIPSGFGFENFRRLLFGNAESAHYSTGWFPRWFLNTLIVSVFTFVLSTIFTLSVAYVMSKMKFKARKPFLNVALILGLFPGFMSIIAIYHILQTFGFLNTYAGSMIALILCYSGGAGLGFYVAKGFFDIIPDSLIESAKLDGATNLQILAQIVLPLSKPIIIYTALTSFLGPWTDFVFAKAILGAQNQERFTVSVGLYSMMNGQFSDGNLFTTFVAGCLLVSIPIVTLFLSMQKYYVSGVTSGAVKG